MSTLIDEVIGTVTIYAEASGESQEARLGVAYTLLNRARTPHKYGATIAEVALRRFQFSSWNDDRGDNANLLRATTLPDTDLDLLACHAALLTALGNTAPDPTGGATHYHDTSIFPPFWTVPPAR